MTDPRFTLDIISAAQASHAKFFPRGPFASITLAQWAVESAYGTRMSGKNNPFGIKATQDQISAGEATNVWTKEFVGGYYRSVEQWFADYPSLIVAFDAHADLLTQSWYKNCLRATTPQDYARALHTDSYATAPNYSEVLISIMDANNLYQFDKGGP